MGLKPFECPVTLLQLLQQAASDRPENGQIFLEKGLDGPETLLPYPELLKQAKANSAALRAAGVAGDGKVTVVYFENHSDNIVWTWSVIAAGGVPAILSPLSNDPKTLGGQMENLENLFGSPVVLTREKNYEQFGRFPSEQVHTVESMSSNDNVHNFRRDSLHDAVDPDALAVLLFTSGSTGHSKAVEFTHRQLIRSVQAKQQQHSLHEDVTFMSWISFDHSANFCELHLNAMNVGANQVSVNTTDLVHEPHRFYEVLSNYQIGYSFSPNSFLAAASRILRQEGNQSAKYDFSNLKVVMVGGEANRVNTMEAADKILREHGAPANAIKAAYGLSETCSACFYNMRIPEWDLERKNLFASVGHPLPVGMEMRLVDDELNPVAHGSDGRIQLRGDVVFKRYYNNQAATDGCMTADGWFDTGDLGRLDDGEFLNIVGRSKEILIINGNNYSSFELEEAIESRKIQGLSPTWTATFSVWDKKSNSEGVVVLFNPFDDIRPHERNLQDTIFSINQAVLTFASAMPVAVIPLPRAEMPKSTIGKLSRQKLKKFYTEGYFDQYIIKDGTPEDADLEPLETPLQKFIAEFLEKESGVPLSSLGANTPIMRTGMNSIAYLRLKRSLEVHLSITEAPLPMNLILQPRTIRGLETAVCTQIEAGRKGQYNPIATLQTGSKTPVFLLPPGGGEFMIWLPLLKHLPGRPVYALRAKGLERHEEVFTDLDEMLSTYENAIRSIQPKGPYVLLGLCFGGVTAFELAKRFLAAGDEVAICGGLDNPPWISKILTNSDIRAFTVEMLAYHHLIPRDSISEVCKRYEGIPDDQVVKIIIADYKSTDMATLGLNAEKLEDWSRVNDVARKVCKTYEPRGKVPKYEVFWVPPLKAWQIKDDVWDGYLRQWSEFVEEGGLRFWRIAGDHFSMLDEENVGAFEKHLNKLLKEAGV